MSGAGKVLAIRQCDNCGKDIKICHKARLSHKNIFCCKQCEGEYRKSHNPNYINCPICGTKFYVKPSKRKDRQVNYCSTKCMGKARENIYLGENNPNYGNTGSKNPLWKSDEKISPYGYKLIRVIEHPFKNYDGFIFEHRLIAEKHLLNDYNSVEINGAKYLSPEFHVHHLDFNRLNNDINNLCVIHKKMHAKFHSQVRCPNKYNVFDANIMKKAFDEFVEQNNIENEIARIL